MQRWRHSSGSVFGVFANAVSDEWENGARVNTILGLPGFVPKNLGEEDKEEIGLWRSISIGGFSKIPTGSACPPEAKAVRRIVSDGARRAGLVGAVDVMRVNDAPRRKKRPWAR